MLKKDNIILIQKLVHWKNKKKAVTESSASIPTFELFILPNHIHSYLMLQGMKGFLLAKMKFQMRITIVSRKTTAHSIAESQSKIWENEDGKLLAERLGLSFPSLEHADDVNNVKLCAKVLNAILKKYEPIKYFQQDQLMSVLDDLISAMSFFMSSPSSQASCRESNLSDADLDEYEERANLLLASLGHYAPATLYHAGEWFMNVNRLIHIQNKLWPNLGNLALPLNTLVSQLTLHLNQY